MQVLELVNNKRLHNDFPVNHSIIEDAKFKKLTSSAKYLYCVMCKLKNRYSGTGEWFWHAEKELSNDAGMSKSTVKTAKKELLAGKFIEAKRGKYMNKAKITPNFYRVMTHKEILEARDWVTNGVENIPATGQKIHRHRPEIRPIIKNDIKNNY